MVKKEFGKRSLSLVLILVMIFGMFGTQVTAAQMTESEYLYMLNTSITIDGKANAIILLPEDASEYEKLAAKELQDHVELVSGAWLPISTQSNGKENEFNATISAKAMTTEKAGYYPFTITLDNPTSEPMNITLAQVGSGKATVLVRGDAGMDGKVELAAGQRAVVNCLVKVSDSSFETEEVTIAVNKDGEQLQAFKIALTGAGQVDSVAFVGNTTFSNSRNWTLGSGAKLDNSTGYNGSKNSLKITGKATVTHKIALGLTSGNLYRLRFWAKTDAAGATVVAKLADSTAKGAALPMSLNTQKVISGTDWTLYEYFFKANVSGDKEYATSMFSLVCNGNLWIDDLSLVDCSKVANAVVTNSSYDYSSFEYDPTAGSSVNKVLFWATSGTGFTGAVTEAQAHSGNKSYELVVPANKQGRLQWGIGTFKDTATDKDDNGKNHSLSIWAKADKSGTPLRVWATVRDTKVTHEETFLLTTEWTRYEMHFTPEGSAKLGVLMGFDVPVDASASGDRTVYLDDVYAVNTAIADAAFVPDEAVETVPQQPELAAPEKKVSGALKFFWKEDTITAGKLGHYPFSVVLHNTSDKTMNLVLQQAIKQEGEPVIQIRGESSLPDKTIDQEAEDFDPGALPPTALEPDYSLPDDAFEGKVTLDAGEKVIVSGLVAVTDISEVKRFPMVINAMDGENLVAEIPLQVNVVPAVGYVGNTTFKSGVNWTLDENSSLDGSTGYQDTTSLKITGTANPTHTAGISMVSGNLYRLRFWAKAASEGTIRAVVDDRLADNTYANMSLNMVKTVTNEWKEYNFYFKANSAQVAEYAFSKLTLNCKGNMWIDDLSLVDCGEPTNKVAMSSEKDYTAFEYTADNKGSANYWQGTLTDMEQHSGKQSIEVKAAPNKSSFMQWSLGLLKADTDVNTPYSICFWAKGQQDGTPLNLTMSRSDAKTPLHTFVLSDEWEYYEYEFFPEEVDSTGKGFVFRLTLPAAESARTIWIDDILFLPSAYPSSIATPNEDLNKRMPSRVAPKEPQFLYLDIEIATADAENTKLREMFTKEITYLETLEGTNGRKYSSDGFAVQKRDQTVYIFGTEDKGTLNGVYDFIEYNAGVLWHRAGQVAYQENENIPLKKYNYYEKSPFSVRGWNSIGTGAEGVQNFDRAFHTQQTRNKMNIMYAPNYAQITSVEGIQALESVGLEDLQLGHNIGTWILQSPLYPGHTDGAPLPEECKVYWNQDKDGNFYTSQSFGNKLYGQINFWDPNGVVSDCVVAGIIQNLEKRKAKGVDVGQVGIGMNDTDNCPQYGYDNKPFEYAPGKFVQPGTDEYTSTVFVTFLNTLQEKLRAKGYDITINVFAYLFLTKAPAADCEIDENIRFVYAPISEDARFPLNMTAEDYPDFANSANIGYHEDLEGWSQVTNNIAVYTYYGCFQGSQTFERSIGKKMQADMKYLAEKGFLGMLPEGQLDSGKEDSIWGQNALTFWLYSKLTWNPNANVDTLIKEYCTKVYGVAANEMLQYYKLLQKAWDNNTEPAAIRWTYALSGYLQNFLMGSGYVSMMQSYLNDAWNKADADLVNGDRIKNAIRPIRDNLDTHVRNTGLVDAEEAIATYTNAGKDTVLNAFDMTNDIWANTTVIKNFYRMGPDGTPTTHAGIDTSLRILWDNKYLYFAYECMDSDIEDIVTTSRLNEAGWFQSKTDDVETFVTTDPAGELLGYFANPKNLYFRYRKMPSAASASYDPTPIDYTANAKLMEDRWVVIQAIPFDSLGITGEVTPETAVYAYFYRGYYAEAKSSQVTLAWNGAGTWQNSAVRQIKLLEAGEMPAPAPSDPSTDTTDPSVPETQPSVPDTQPSVPETQPSVPETQPSVPATQPGDATEQPGTPVGLIIGLVAAVVVIIGGGAVAFIFYRKKKANEATESAEAEDTAEVTE